MIEFVSLCQYHFENFSFLGILNNLQKRKLLCIQVVERNINCKRPNCKLYLVSSRIVFVSSRTVFVSNCILFVFKLYCICNQVVLFLYSSCNLIVLKSYFICIQVVFYFCLSGGKQYKLLWLKCPIASFIWCQVVLHLYSSCIVFVFKSYCICVQVTLYLYSSGGTQYQL